MAGRCIKIKALKYIIYVRNIILPIQNTNLTLYSTSRMKLLSCYEQQATMSGQNPKKQDKLITCLYMKFIHYFFYLFFKKYFYLFFDISIHLYNVLFLLDLFILRVFCLNVCTTCVPAWCLWKPERGHWIHWDWSNGWL